MSANLNSIYYSSANNTGHIHKYPIERTINSNDIGSDTFAKKLKNQINADT